MTLDKLVLEYYHEKIGFYNLYKAYTRLVQAKTLSADDWYQAAYDDCGLIAAHFNLPVDRVVAIVATLSPGISWKMTLDCAVKLITAYRIGTHCENLSLATYRANKRKAWNLLLSADLVLSGRKVAAFYHAITGNPDSVVVDRHMIHLYLYGLDGKRSGALRISDKSYTLISDVIGQAARQANLTPARFQALIWGAQAR